jgi:hypothetical protein
MLKRNTLTQVTTQHAFVTMHTMSINPITNIRNANVIGDTTGKHQSKVHF